jgi:hypothetical protein
MVDIYEIVPQDKTTQPAPGPYPTIDRFELLNSRLEFLPYEPTALVSPARELLLFPTFLSFLALCDNFCSNSFCLGDCFATDRPQTRRRHGELLFLPRQPPSRCIR